MQGQDGGALMCLLSTGCKGFRVFQVVQAKVSPHLYFAQGTLPEL